MTKIGIRLKPTLSIREKVYQAIRRMILDGAIPPGERIVETRLAQEIGASRTPVREALHMLEREGLLESIPRVGYRLRTMQWEEVEQICEIRLVNETLAARWAMKRMTPKEFEALENNILSAEEEVKRGNPKAFVDKDAEFHEIIARASGSERLYELCQLLRKHMLRYRVESVFLAETALTALRAHRRILESLKADDERGMEDAVRTHLEETKSDIYRHAFGDVRASESIEKPR